MYNKKKKKIYISACLTACMGKKKKERNEEIDCERLKKKG